MFKKMETQILSLITALMFSVSAIGGTCTSDTRTNVSPNSVLTSTKYNADLNTLYDRLAGNVDGGCITDGSVESGTLGDGIVNSAKLANSSVTLAKLAQGAFGSNVTTTLVNYTADASDDVILVDASSDSITISLPTAVGSSGKMYLIQPIDSTTDTTVTIDPNGAETIGGKSTLVLYGKDNKALIISDNSNWRLLNHLAPTVCNLYEIQTAGTAGGGSTSQLYHTRVLNTTKGVCNWLTLASNQIQLLYGRYDIECTMPSYQGSDQHAIIYNITDGTVDTVGTNAFGSTTYEGGAYSHVKAALDISTTTTYEAQHFINTGQASNGLGINASDGTSDETYTHCSVTKWR